MSPTQENEAKLPCSEPAVTLIDVASVTNKQDNEIKIEIEKGR